MFAMSSVSRWKAMVGTADARRAANRGRTIANAVIRNGGVRAGRGYGPIESERCAGATEV